MNFIFVAITFLTGLISSDCQPDAPQVTLFLAWIPSYLETIVDTRNYNIRKFTIRQFELQPRPAMEIDVDLQLISPRIKQLLGDKIVYLRSIWMPLTTQEPRDVFIHNWALSGAAKRDWRNPVTYLNLAAQLYDRVDLLNAFRQIGIQPNNHNVINYMEMKAAIDNHFGAGMRIVCSGRWSRPYFTGVEICFDPDSYQIVECIGHETRENCPHDFIFFPESFDLTRKTENLIEEL